MEGTIALMKKLKLTQGKYALVDDEDYNWLNNYKWRYQLTQNKKNYRSYERARTTVGKRPNRKTIMLHRMIMSKYHNIDGVIIDHIDGDCLNNQKSNLRLANKSLNAANKVSVKVTSSLYKGVCYLPPKKGVRKHPRWRAEVKKDGVILFQKNFKTEIEAAEAYNIEAKKAFGDFALLNKI